MQEMRSEQPDSLKKHRKISQRFFENSRSHYIGYQLDVLFTKLLWLHTKLWKQDNQFIYVTCFIIINQLVLWHPSVNYYFISWRQGSTFNPRLSVSLHQLELTVFIY